MSIPRPGPAAIALLIVAVSTLFNGATGFVVGLGVVMTLAVTGRPRTLIIMAAALFVLTPLSMLRQGLVTPEELSLQLVSRYSMANNLAFAGFAYLVVGVLLDVHRPGVVVEGEAPGSMEPDPESESESESDLESDPEPDPGFADDDLTPKGGPGEDRGAADPMMRGFAILERVLSATDFPSSDPDETPTEDADRA